MKKKAGQAQGNTRTSGARNSQLVPVRNSDNKPAESRQPKVIPYEEPEFDYASLAKNYNGSQAGKKSGSRSRSSSKNSSSRSRAKKKNPAPIIAIVAAVILIAGAIFAGLYYIEFFKPHIKVTMADGSVQSITTEAAYAELMTNKFYSGTVIDGIDVGGMTMDEAYNAVTTTLPEAPLEVSIKLDLLGKKLYPDFKGVNFEYNTREILEEAYAKYRPVNDTDVDQLIECYNGVQQLKNNPQTYETAYTVHIEGVQEQIKKVLDPYVAEYSTVKNASIVEFDTDTHEFIIDKEKEGYVIDVDATSKAVKALFDSKTYVGTITVPTTITKPEITEAMINENFGLIGKCSTTTTGNNNRNNNIRQACNYINGTILEPGDVFSFNNVVQERTYDRGFREATVILGGQYEEGLGGGICQVSSTLYNAVLKANLKIVERNWHAWPSSYIPTGLDATVDWPNLDLKFENDTDFQVIVVTWWDSSDYSCNAEIYGQKLPDGKYIELYAEIVSSTSPGADEYIEDKELPVGETKTLREAHKGITANAYKIWYNSDGEETDRVLCNTTYYRAFGRRISVGVLNPDGTYATMDKSTGEITSPILTPTPSPSVTPDPTVTITVTPAPATDTPTPEPATATPVPDTPAPEPATPAPEPDTPTPDAGDGEEGENP